MGGIMPRTTDNKQMGFIWLPRESPAIYDIKINSVSVIKSIHGAEFTRALCPEVGYFKIELDNNDKAFTDYFSDEQTVELFVDYVDGTTRRFLGSIDTLKNKYGDMGYTLEVAGNHVSGELLNKTVTESFSGDTTISAIITSLVAEYLTGYTINYTASSTDTPTINWNNKPFWECIYDLTKLASADAYVSDAKVIQLFDKNSVENNDEAIVWNDTLIDVEGIGEQSLTKKDKIIVYGDDGEGLPVISVSGTGNKESVIFDSKITSEDQASELSAAELVTGSETPTEGKALAFLLPTLNPGDKIWITNPQFNILGQYPIYKFTHKFYDENTECFIQTDKDTPHLMKNRIESELALQSITNANKCVASINLKFDDLTELTTHDANVYLSEGKVKLSSGAEGVFTKTKTSSFDVTAVEIRVVGSNTLGTRYRLSTDGGTNYTLLLADSLVTVPAGTSLVLEVTLLSASTEINSLAVLYK